MSCTGAPAELAHVTRPATLGELTAPIAHQINQPSAAVVATGDAGVCWLTREPSHSRKVRTSTAKMIANARRARRCCRAARSPKSADAQRAALDMTAVIDETLLLAQWEIVVHRIELDPPSLRRCLACSATASNSSGSWSVS